MKWLTENAIWLLFSLVIIIAVTHSQNAEAETDLYLGAWSKHFDSYDYNEENRLLAVSHNNWVGGRFDNSYGRETWFAGYDFKWRGEFFQAGVLAAVSRGYTTCFGDDGSSSNICPMPLPYISINDTVAPIFFVTHQMFAISIKIEL